jgi:hypothetical protein
MHVWSEGCIGGFFFFFSAEAREEEGTFLVPAKEICDAFMV